MGFPFASFGGAHSLLNMSFVGWTTAFHGRISPTSASVITSSPAAANFLVLLGQHWFFRFTASLLMSFWTWRYRTWAVENRLLFAGDDVVQENGLGELKGLDWFCGRFRGNWVLEATMLLTVDNFCKMHMMQVFR